MPPSESTTPISEPDDEPAKSLLVYFSWSGNTESVAVEIGNQTGADIFELVPEEAYTDDYNALLDIAREEQKNNARPAISGSIDNLADYDVIFLGYPNWWADMPMILCTFLGEYDLSGKTIAPFCTSGGSGFSGTISALKSLEPDAEVLDGLHLGSSAAKNPESAVTEWLDSIGLNE
jgi:flavodoxin